MNPVYVWAILFALRLCTTLCSFRVNVFKIIGLHTPPFRMAPRQRNAGSATGDRPNYILQTDKCKFCWRHSLRWKRKADILARFVLLQLQAKCDIINQNSLKLEVIAIWQRDCYKLQQLQWRVQSHNVMADCLGDIQPTNLREGNIFSRVCLSFYPRREGVIERGMYTLFKLELVMQGP